jgi:hypothetical protein
MASFRIFGPYAIYYVALFPGESIGTYWLGWTPPPKFGQFTVTVTAHPSPYIVNGADRIKKVITTLSVSATSVEYVAQPSRLEDKLIVRATLTNTGSEYIQSCYICLTFVEI